MIRIQDHLASDIMATSRKQSAQDPVGTIRTRRLILQPLTQADAPGVYALRSNPQIFHWRKSVDTKSQSDTWLYALSSLPSPLPVSRHRHLCTDHGLASNENLSAPVPNLNYTVRLCPALIHTSDADIVGMVGGVRLPEVGYIYDPSIWGNGFATEALRGWMDMYWSRWPDGHPALPWEDRGYLRAVTGQHNGGMNDSGNVLKKCGFQKSGEKEVEEEGSMVRLEEWVSEKPRRK